MGFALISLKSHLSDKKQTVKISYTANSGIIDYLSNST